MAGGGIMKMDFKSSFPKKLRLWMEGDILKYKVEEKALSPAKIGFLKENKEFFIKVIKDTGSKILSVLPLAHNQKALWFLQKVSPENSSYLISLAAEIKNPLNIDAVTLALSLLQEQHPMLRTIFTDLPDSDNLACQIVLEKTGTEIEQITELNPDREHIRRLLKEKSRKPFNLEGGPMFRVLIVNTPHYSILNFNFHHIICDAISLKNLLNDFIRLYSSINQSESIVKSSPDQSYGNFIFDQIDFLCSKPGEAGLRYWLKELNGKPHTLNLPAKSERPPVHQFNGGTLLFRVDGERYASLRQVARKNGVTFNVLLLSVYEYFISKITLQCEFFVGLPAAARTKKDFENTFGYFINLLPLGCTLSDVQTFTDFLDENKKRIYEGLENQRVPFPVIVQKASPRRDLSRTPVFQVVFNYLNKKALGCLAHFLGDHETDKYSSWGSLLIKPFKVFDQEGQFDLTLEIIDDDKQLICALKYNSDIFDNESADIFKGEFLKITDMIIEDPSARPYWLTEKPTEKSVKTALQINITGTFTVEPLKPYLEFWFDKVGVKPDIEFPGYNQVFSQLLNPASEFNSNSDGYNILLIRLEDWLKDKNSNNYAGDFELKTEEFNDSLSAAFENNKSGKYIIAFCPPSPHILKNPVLSGRISKAENRFLNSLKLRSNVVVSGSGELTGTYGVNDYYEELGEEIGNIPFTDEFFISLATIIVRKIEASVRPPFKAIAVDCDNTLWKGVVAEDGALGVTIGKPEQALQHFLVDQMNEGILICLCSKNISEDVFEVFEKNQQMILHKEHIAFHRINWNPKSENLIGLAEEINIGLDSFVFIDDSPLECAEVRANAPDVLTIQLPEQGFSMMELGNSWIFDRLRVTEEDRKRIEKYREEVVRSGFRSSVRSYKEFIDGLNLKIEITPFRDENIPRISQLTFRTNQFNFTTIRRTETEIRSIAGDKNHECFEVSLTDRFGEYGLIGVIIVNKLTGYNVDTFLLSCRVLGKGVEHFLVSFLGERARSGNFSYLSIQFRKTEKNTPALDFLVSNFGDLNYVNDETHLFNIPAERAVGFVFNPELQAAGSENTDDAKIKTSHERPDIQHRNDFFHMILDKYLSLEKLVGELNGVTTRKTEPGQTPLKNAKETERSVMSVWQRVLKSENFGYSDNFFDIGGHSVMIPQIVITLLKQFNIRIAIVDIFQYPTVSELAAFIEREEVVEKPASDKTLENVGNSSPGNDIAVIGMSGRFSGVQNIEEYWDVISSGKETISYYTKEELLEKGVDRNLLDDKDYVLANGNIESADQFDSTFFGITPREADFMDPQHRVFLETCYEALENAGYTSANYEGEIGVFAGCGMNNYLIKNLFQHPGSLRSAGEFQTIINNNSDYLTTRVSYKMNLTGPSINIQTACSTSLVAIHIACQNLIHNNCDIALAGGVFIQIPHAEGYMYEQGGIFSPDGHCRPFDSEADGTLFGEGSGVIVLKRLEDALKDQDTISAVIKGSAINNDGSGKVGYMAPSVNGQSTVVSKAIASSGISTDTISYIETHGTGTRLGDPIEVKALGQVFKAQPGQQKYCALGSVKANIGHLDAAAGVAAVIKVVMMLKNRKLPPQPNYNLPNPELSLREGPFYINQVLKEWPSENNSRRAGISSFGIGGTNAHCILEEAPETIHTVSSKTIHLLPVTAKTPQALRTLKEKITRHLSTPGQEIADIAFTLQQGRNHYKHRSLLVCKTDPERKEPFLISGSVDGVQELFNPDVIFMFTGQGSQYIGMAEELYYEFTLFRNILDRANLLLIENFNVDILKYILHYNGDALQDEINQTSVAQPILFTVQYGIARLFKEFGIRPDAVIGHSIGEYAAATISGILEFEDALKLVAYRAKLMQDQKPGAMLSVQLSYKDLLPYISEKINLSVRNAPEINVLSGDFQDIEDVRERLSVDHPGIHLSILKTSHAFHSYMMEPVLEPFGELLKTIKFGESRIPVISNKTGSRGGSLEMSTAEYWSDQIVSPVNFVDGVEELIKPGNSFFIEVGPGNTLVTLLSQYNIAGKKIKFASSLRHPKKKISDVALFLSTVSDAWVSGVNIDWNSFYKDEKRFRVPLPAYPFDRKRHWIDPVSPFNYFYEYKGEISQGRSDSPEPVQTGESAIESSISFHTRPVMDNDFIAPVSETEVEIVKVWEELLGIRGIGVKDDFFFLGGHSLLASQVITRISEKFHIRLPLESLFSSPTIRGLASLIESAIPEGPDEPEIIALKHDTRLPVSFDQKRLWVLNQIDRNNPAYNIPFTYRLKGRLDVEAFTGSLNLLFERQAILRSSIRSDEGEPYCIINEFENIPIKILDNSSLEAEESERAIQEYFSRESRTLFDIENGPLFRLYLVKTGDNDHIFHMSVQHMVFDGWSWGIFTGDLRHIYNDILNKRKVSLEPLQYQYFDIAGWQNRIITEDTYRDSIDYWIRQLANHPSEINFPFDRARNNVQSGFGARESVKLSAGLSAKIRALSQGENSTTFMTMLAAFALLLNKYSGDDDICIGVPTANRGNSKIERIIGLFVNTIILRMRFESSQSFKELLHSSRQITLEALSHNDLPFEKLVEILQPERKGNMNPVTQILFAYQNTPRPLLDLEGITPERILIKETVSPLDITFYAWESAGIIEGEIEYNTDLIDSDTITRLADNFVFLLETVIHNPDIKLSDISIISETEKQKLEGFNNTQVPLPDCLIQDFFMNQVRSYPDKTAVISGLKRVTYKELEEQANLLSDRLIQLGAVSGDAIGVYVERSVEMVVSILGILKAGCCYLPLDPAFPADRLSYMFEDSGAKIIVTQKSLKERSGYFISASVLLIDEKDGGGRRSPVKNHIIKSDPDSLAYLLYTSGSTGKPKGVKVHHRAVVNLIGSMSKNPGVTKDDVLLAVVTLSFDMSVFEMFLPLSNGATIVIADSQDIRDGKALINLVEKHNITILQAAPSLFYILLASGWRGKANLRALCGGEALTSGIVKKILPNVGELWNCYGPTETTVFSTIIQITDPDGIILIGKPIDNTRIYVLDKNNRLLPSGATGEIGIGGLGVAKGYINQSSLTAEKFIQMDDGTLVYKTGDRGRFLKDGNIELFGRIDNQVKIRGIRIEPSEIEVVLSKIEGINEPVVKLQKFGENDERLVAFLNVTDAFRAETREINNRLKETLPLYMIPSAYRIMREFPRTSNGKIDRKALVFETTEAESITRVDKADMTSAEKIIHSIWFEALKTPDISVTDNFFEIGGNSLLAISVFSKIESAFNVKMNLRLFFDGPRIQDLGEIVDIALQNHGTVTMDKKITRSSKIVKGAI
jgi:amino acid adenylation domain-containing protein/FkbH-like protein